MPLPTTEQITYAENIADQLGVKINPDMLKDGLTLSMWSKSNAGKLREKSEEN